MDDPGKQPAAKLNADFFAGAAGKIPPLPESAGDFPLLVAREGDVLPVGQPDPVAAFSRFEQCCNRLVSVKTTRTGGVLLRQPPTKIVVGGAVWLVMANVTPLRGVQSLHATRFPEKYLFREKAQFNPRLSSPAHRRCGGGAGGKINEGS